MLWLVNKDPAAQVSYMPNASKINSFEYQRGKKRIHTQVNHRGEPIYASKINSFEYQREKKYTLPKWIIGENKRLP